MKLMNCADLEYKESCSFRFNRPGIKRAIKQFSNNPHKYGGKTAVEPFIHLLEELLQETKGNCSKTTYYTEDELLLDFMHLIDRD